VRLITATNRDLLTHIAAGAFREDLYFRLNVIRLTIPPLRERADDLPLLIDHFMDSFSEHHRLARPVLSDAAMEALVSHRWPGNIRELKNVVERLILKAHGEPIRPMDLPPEIFRSADRTLGKLETMPELQVKTRGAVEEMLGRILQGGESFWSVVYPVFMSRDLTRDDLRRIVQVGLENTNGSYRLMTQLFNMPESDYKRFLSFLRKHDCHLPFQRFRVVNSRLPTAGVPYQAAAVGKA